MIWLYQTFRACTLAASQRTDGRIIDSARIMNSWFMLEEDAMAPSDAHNAMNHAVLWIYRAW